MYEGACWKTTRYLWGDCMVWQIYMDGPYYRLYWPVIWVTLSQAKLYLAGWDEKWKKLKEMSDMKCVRTGIHQTWKWYDMSVIKCKNVWSCKMYGLYGGVCEHYLFLARHERCSANETRIRIGVSEGERKTTKKRTGREMTCARIM